jgi:hypothetical protein
VLPGNDSAFTGHVSHPAVPTELLNVPTSHALHNANPTIQLAVKPLPVVAASDVKRTRRCCFVVAYVASAGEPLSVASRTTPDEHAESPHSSTYT